MCEYRKCFYDDEITIQHRNLGARHRNLTFLTLTSNWSVSKLYSIPVLGQVCMCRQAHVLSWWLLTMWINYISVCVCVCVRSIFPSVILFLWMKPFYPSIYFYLRTYNSLDTGYLMAKMIIMSMKMIRMRMRMNELL